MTLPQLVARADMVIQGHIISAKAELNDEQTAIWSTYRIQPLRELLNKTEGPVASTSSGGTFEVRTLGGELQIAGRTVRMRHSHLAPYEAGQQVVLFLKKTPKPDAYEIVAPPYGSLDIQDGRVVIGDPVRTSPLDGFRGADLDTVATRIQQIATPTPR